MPCLTKDSKGRSQFWYVCYTTPDGRRLKTSTGQTDKAKAWEFYNTKIAVEAEITNGRPTEKRLREIINDALARLGEQKLRSDPTIKQQLDTWVESKRDAVADSTIAAYEQTRGMFLDFLGPRANRSVRLLTKDEVIEFRNHLRSEGRTAGTVNKLVRLYLNSAFEDAKTEGVIDHNPFSAVDALKVTKVKKDRFTAEQVVRLLKAAEGTGWTGAILVAYGTGARLQDVANLKWSAIDSDNGLLTFEQRKTGKETVVGLHPDFEDWIARQPPSDDPDGCLFPTLANREAGGRNGLSAEFSGIMEKAGVAGKILRERDRKGRQIRSLSFHSFRYGAASHIFNQAALADVARRVTGHAARGAISGYIREDVEMLKAATQLIPRLPKGDS
jgi:integrase